MQDTVIKIVDLKKKYKLGSIGGGTLSADLQSWWAKKTGKDDPNLKIGEKRESGTEFWALNGVNLEVKAGETLGIIGSNGAGKSTLLKILSRVTAPTEGEVKIKGRISSMLEVGTGFHGELTGRENIYLNGAILGMSRSEVDKKMEDIIEFSECRKFIDTPVKRYSSGMYVKLAFSVAAHLDSEILVMDEVLAVGDMKFQEKCLGKMGDVADKEGRTVLYVSHNMNTIRQLCTRCVVLDHGKKIYDGDTETAIGIYADCRKKMEYHYDYRAIPRPVIRSLKLEFLEMDVLNHPDEAIAVGDPVYLKLRCRANRDFEKILIRFEIIASDNSVAGTMFSHVPLNKHAESEFELNLKLNTSHMVPGSYRFDMLAFERNDFGMQDFVDRIEGALQLDIVKKDSSDIEWLPQYWGHTKFCDIEFI